MIDFIINLLVSAGVLMLLAYILPAVTIKSFKTALWVAFLIGLLNATIGAIIRFPINLFTLYLLEFVVKLIVTAIIIKLVDMLVKNFQVKGFLTALIIAVVLAASSTLVHKLTSDDDRYKRDGRIENRY